jgi:predicted nucleic acid-binding protein
LILVVDASVVGHWLLSTRLPPQLMVTRFAGDASLAAPYLIDAEVGHLLRRHALLGRVSAERARIALDDYVALPVDRYAHLALLPRAFALRDNATIYDALYLALAEALKATLLTRDRRLAWIPGAGAHVEVVTDGA